MDKRLLTSRELSIDAGFNKLPVQEAKFNSLRIKDLPTHSFCAKHGYAANSYKGRTRGITRLNYPLFMFYFHAFRALSRTSMRTASGIGLRLCGVSAFTQTHSS